MNAVDLIIKKRNDGELTPDEIAFLINGATSESIPDYQLAAWLMAVWFRGMTPRETYALTDAMVKSGQVADLSSISGVKVDKHSTGGVGDKTTLIVAPLAAAGGIPVVKMAGRGLGFTGGTLDKLESIPGFTTSLSIEQFTSQVNSIGLAVVGAGAQLAPADKRLYALRDVTGTVDSTPLIAASVMSKKIAGGADAFVLDVKTGAGAFMKSRAEAELLAHTLLEIAQHAQKRALAMVTGMDQPLGNAVGNALEVAESLEILHGRGPSDLREICLALTGAMLWVGGQSNNLDEGRLLAEKLLDTGKALDKFREWVIAQKGNPGIVEQPDLLPKAPIQELVSASSSGTVIRIDAAKIGHAAMLLGAGRIQKNDSIDHSAGILLEKKVGDVVSSSEILATLHTSDLARIPLSRQLVLEAFQIGQSAPKPPELIQWVGTV